MQRKSLGSMFIFLAFATTATHAASRLYPLHKAAESGDIETLRRLLQDKTIDVNEQMGQYKRTPLHYAAQRGKFECLQELMANSANIEAQDIFGETPLHHAAANDKSECLVELLAHGANIHARDNSNRTAVHHAVTTKNGTAQCLKELLAHGADTDIEAQDVFDGKRPLHQAAWCGNFECLVELITQGADVNAQTTTGETPLDCTNAFHHATCANYLKAKMQNNVVEMQRIVQAYRGHQE